MLRILKPQFVSNLTRCLVRAKQGLFSPPNQFVLDIFRSGLSCLSFYHIPEIIRRQKYFISKIFDGRQTFL